MLSISTKLNTWIILYTVDSPTHCEGSLQMAYDHTLARLSTRSPCCISERTEEKNKSRTSTGYKDELVFDEDGKPLLRRTTPLHQVVKVDLSRSLPKLFKIYQRADANYTDESGLSHFHVACMNGFDDVVKRFLELGQDSNCIREETDLRDVFRREEIECLLSDSVCMNSADTYICAKKEVFVGFVARSGYKDEPDVDEDGRLLLPRTTPLHRAASSSNYRSPPNLQSTVRELFKIYVRLDVNYTDEKGLTHFHVACRYGCDEIVEKFLRLGRDPNYLVENRRLTATLGFEART
ncbi:unnamed protein product [Trichogramma brassicae]|uniref:Uncharacterized protein n=1 Tax=Trichogramma brassicae TaxID=86971 RepID=A0A6H5IZN2_9HYME|nr:unnamed protein product [Trichogramma brassicae]